MAGQTLWAVVIVAVIAAALIGFFLGRVSSGGARQRMEELEAEAQRQKDEIAGYKREVDAHFDKTATLFVSMAGSYKDLFEHLSSGYERLSEGSSRDLFKERVATLLLDGPDRSAPSNYVHDDGEEVHHAKVAATGDAAGGDEPGRPDFIQKVEQSEVDAPGESVASQTSGSLPPDAPPDLEPETAAGAGQEPVESERADAGEVEAAGATGEARRTEAVVDTDGGTRPAGVEAEAVHDEVSTAEEATPVGKVADGDQRQAAVEADERKG